MPELPILQQSLPRQASIFDSRSLPEIYGEVQELYLADDRPWVVGYSGGKDSTCALQVIWLALTGLEPSQLRKTVYVISSDTLVETPVIVKYIDTTLQRISEAAKDRGLPIEANK